MAFVHYIQVTQPVIEVKKVLARVFLESRADNKGDLMRDMRSLFRKGGISELEIALKLQLDYSEMSWEGGMLPTISFHLPLHYIGLSMGFKLVVSCKENLMRHEL